MTVLAGISKRKRYGSLSSLNSDISISALSRSLKMSLTRLRDHRRWATPFAHPSVRPSVVWKMTIRVPGDRRNISFVLEIPPAPAPLARFCTSLRQARHRGTTPLRWHYLCLGRIPTARREWGLLTESRRHSVRMDESLMMEFLPSFPCRPLAHAVVPPFPAWTGKLNFHSALKTQHLIG